MKQTDSLWMLFVALFIVFFTSCKDETTMILPKLNTMEVSEITHNSAKTGGKIRLEDYSQIIEKGVCWSTNSNPTKEDSYVVENAGSASYECILNKLLPETDYHVRAFASNAIGTSYGEDKAFTTLPSASVTQIIADHTVVDKFDDIPLEWIDSVKKMWLVVAGESHALGYRNGLSLFESLFPLFDVNITSYGEPEGYTESYLRMSCAMWGDLEQTTGWVYKYGEEDWFTTTLAITRTLAGITYCNDNELTISALGFGWCYDPGVKIDNYLIATQTYIDYCAEKGYRTKMFFTTGPVDAENSTGEEGYIKYFDHEAIREYVRKDMTRILFDYADILCYDNGSNIPNTTTWNGHVYPIITTTNLTPTISAYHISEVGAVRLAKALWWMMARIAGWEGS